MHTTDFETALASFREMGGAMNFWPASSQPELPDTWEVDDADALQERITCSVREATENAMRNGGLRQDEIQLTLAGWVDPPQRPAASSRAGTR